MIVAAGSALSAVLLSVTAPPLLRGMMTSFAPRVVAAAWLTCIGAVVFFTCFAVVVLAWPGHAPALGAVEATMQCLTSLLHAAPQWFAHPFTALAVLAALAATTRVAVIMRRHLRRRARIQDYHRDVIAVVARCTDDVVPVMWLDHSMPMAYSVDGRPGMVVATEGLARSLTEMQRRAVLAHEHAHLRGHHHRAIRICEVMAAALPWIPLFAAAPRAVTTLAELAADESAARDTSAAAIHAALRSVSQSRSTDSPSALRGFGDEVITMRLRRLESLPSNAPRESSALAVLLLPPILALAVAALGVLAAGGIACLLSS
ncbi:MULTISPECIES: M56 family metallopeptidase [Nocardia]|uniref:M56 family metallopeptidase n=1 Tax=Nocardia TaxID=1817 RepID=UPI0003191F5E|nr:MULTISPECIES: M56 family metallopeptidase [Nocardia]